MITHDGKVGPCANWATKIQENILSSSLEKIWFGENFNSFRERIKSKNLRGCRCCIPYVFDTNRLRFKLKEKLIIAYKNMTQNLTKLNLRLMKEISKRL